MKKSHENRIEKDSGRIRRMFAEISPRYDFLNHVLSGCTDVSWRRRTVRALELRRGARVLDICTGTADLALEIATTRSPVGKQGREAESHRVVGLDFTPEMLRIGERKRARRNVRNVSLVQGDALDLPFPDGSFDAVTVAFGIRNVQDLRRGFREMRRVLRPGGRAAILEFSPPGRGLRGRLFDVYFRAVLPRLGGWISGVPSGKSAYSYLPQSVGEFPPPEELSSILEECELCVTRRIRLILGVATIHIASPSRVACPAPAEVATPGGEP